MKKAIHLLNNLSIKAKLLLFILTMVLTVILFSWYLNDNNFNMIDQFDATMNDYYLINNLMTSTSRNKEAMDKYISDMNDLDQDLYEASKAEMANLLETLKTRFTSVESHFAINAISNSMDVYGDLWDNAIYERDHDIKTYYQYYYDGQRIQAYTEGYIEELLYISLNEGTELYNQLAHEAEIMRRISLILILIFSGVTLAMAVLVANSLAGPIKKVADASTKMAHGDLEVEAIDVSSHDEIGALADAFNIMSKNIKAYVSDLEQKVIIEKKLHDEELELMRMEQMLKDARFKALQSQINPHFLFNTLNTISRTALLEDSDTTIKLIQALSTLFRYKLQKDDHMVPMIEEIGMINEYIYLQKYRFKERLAYSLEMDELSGSIEIPIFTLQPLVENAIIHGIEPKAEGGSLRICIKTTHEGDRLFTKLIIEDTGVGMSPERLNKVKEFGSINQRSIGVTNVYQRLKMTYTQWCHFEVTSELGKGTKLLIEFYS